MVINKEALAKEIGCESSHIAYYEKKQMVPKPSLVVGKRFLYSDKEANEIRKHFESLQRFQFNKKRIAEVTK